MILFTEINTVIKRQHYEWNDTSSARDENYEVHHSNCGLHNQILPLDPPHPPYHRYVLICDPNRNFRQNFKDQECTRFPEILTCTNWEFSSNRQSQCKYKKNYQAQTPRNLALTNILQNFSKTAHPWFRSSSSPIRSMWDSVEVQKKFRFSWGFDTNDIGLYLD